MSDIPFSATGPWNQPISALEAGILYIREGWAVVPIISPSYEYIYTGRKVGKQPFYDRFKHPLRSAEEAETFFSKHPNASIGIKTGPESGIFIIDIDEPDTNVFMGIELPSTRTVLTKRGRHLYFQYSKNDIVHTVSPSHYGDVFGVEEGLVTAPPTVRADGFQYMWADFSAPVLPAPESLLTLIKSLQPHNYPKTFAQYPRRYTKAFVNTQIRNVLALFGR